MDNLNNPDSLSSFNKLSKKELESILNRQGDIPKEQVEAIKNLLSKHRKGLAYAIDQIEQEKELEEILSQLKSDGFSEDVASKMIQEASLKADLDKKKKVQAQQEAAQEGGGVMSVLGVIFTIFIVVRLLIRLFG